MATVMHEALHAYTRKPDQFADHSLKFMLGCNFNDLNPGGTADITLFLMQFLGSNAIPAPQIQKCSEFFGQTLPEPPPR
jgi:hypothetical protein